MLSHYIESRRLPSQLIAVRHGQSIANAVFPDAEAAGALSVDISERDADLPLTGLGLAQAAALGQRLVATPPEVVYCSPYLRARQTLTEVLTALDAAGVTAPRLIRFDERLRDRETGAWEMRTFAELRLSDPAEMARRDRIGAFYFRPPGGENFPDVALRVRSLLRDLFPLAAGRRLLLVCHDATVLMLRLIIEHLSEQELSNVVDAGGMVGNCTITRYVASANTLSLRCYNDDSHLVELSAVRS